MSCPSDDTLSPAVMTAAKRATLPYRPDGRCFGFSNERILSSDVFVALALVGGNFNERGGVTGGAVNQDGNFDNLDITPFVNLLLAGGQEVPEPITFVLLALGGVAMLRRKR